MKLLTETYSSSVYTGLRPYVAKHSPSAADVAAETHRRAAEGQLSGLGTLIETGGKNVMRERIDVYLEVRVVKKGGRK